MLNVLILPKDGLNKNISIQENIFLNQIKSFELYKLNDYTKSFFEMNYTSNEFDFILNKKIYETNIFYLLKYWSRHPSIIIKFRKANLFLFYKDNKVKNTNKNISDLYDNPELYLNEIHKKSKGFGSKIGIIDDGYNLNIIDKSKIYSFYPYNDIGNHGKSMHNLIKLISPKSDINFIKVSENHTTGRNDHELTILLGIIACIILKCDIINISHSINLNKLKAKLYSELFNEINYSFKIPIILAAGNNNLNITKNELFKYYPIFTIGAFDVEKKIKSRYSNYGNTVCIYMPTRPLNNFHTSHAAILFTGFIANWFSLNSSIQNKLISTKYVINNYSINLSKYSKLKTLNITKLFKIMKKPNIKKRVKRTHQDEIPFLFEGIITKAYAPQSPISSEVLGKVQKNSPTQEFNFRGYENIQNGSRVYFLAGNFKGNDVAVNLVQITDSNFDLNKISLYCPERAGNPENQGTVVDTRPPTLARSTTYYVIDSSKSVNIPFIYECTSSRELSGWEHVEYDSSGLSEPFPIVKINGIWSDEN